MVGAGGATWGRPIFQTSSAGVHGDLVWEGDPDKMSRKWIDAVRAEGIDSTDDWLQKQLSNNGARTKDSKGNEQQVLVQVSARSTADRRSISLWLRGGGRERVAGCFRFWRECFCQQCIWCDCSQFVQQIERLGCGGQDGTGRVALQIGWYCCAVDVRRCEDNRHAESKMWEPDEMNTVRWPSAACGCTAAGGAQGRKMRDSLNADNRQAKKKKTPQLTSPLKPNLSKNGRVVASVTRGCKARCRPAQKDFGTNTGSLLFTGYACDKASQQKVGRWTAEKKFSVNTRTGCLVTTSYSWKLSVVLPWRALLRFEQELRKNSHEKGQRRNARRERVTTTKCEAGSWSLRSLWGANDGTHGVPINKRHKSEGPGEWDWKHSGLQKTQTKRPTACRTWTQKASIQNWRSSWSWRISLGLCSRSSCGQERSSRKPKSGTRPWGWKSRWEEGRRTNSETGRSGEKWGWQGGKAGATVVGGSVERNVLGAVGLGWAEIGSSVGAWDGWLVTANRSRISGCHFFHTACVQFRGVVCVQCSVCVPSFFRASVFFSSRERESLGCTARCSPRPIFAGFSGWFTELRTWH